MTPDTCLLWWWLHILDYRRYTALIDRFGSLDEASLRLSPQLLRELNMREEKIASVLSRREAFKPERYLFEMARRKIDLFSIEDERYPQALKNIADPPVFLSAIGNLEALSHPMIGVVGTREMSGYGKRVVEAFVPPLARAGLTTVSGLALGVDAAVARETLRAGGRTVAVLGHGLARIYPQSNSTLADEIVARGGVLLSEFPLEVPPDKYTFPARNRIIAGLSKAPLVCEAPEGSGAIITAKLALEYGRDVFAVPGTAFDEHFAGCNQLIAQSEAQLAGSADDILVALGYVPGSKNGKRPFSPQSEHEEILYRLLTAMPQSVDQLVERSGLDAAQVGVALTMMELSSAVRSLGGGQWIRT